jgi:hypothetical protein
MFHFLLTFIFAVTVYDMGPPPIVGVGGSAADASKHMEVLKRLSAVTWKGEGKTTKTGIHYSNAIRDYTFCHSTLDGKTWSTVLYGELTDENVIESGVQSLIAEYNKVFDGAGNPTQYARQSCTPYAQKSVTPPVSVLPALQDQIQSALKQLPQQSDPQAQANQQASAQWKDGTYQFGTQSFVLFYGNNQPYYSLTNFYQEGFQAEHPSTGQPVRVAAAEILFQAYKGLHDPSSRSNEAYINVVLACRTAREAFDTAQKQYPRDAMLPN